MEFLKKIGEFFQNHYEKILLSLVLLGLAGAAAYLPVKIKQSREGTENVPDANPARVEPLKPIDLSSNIAALTRSERLERLDLGREHLLLNSVPWRRKPDGTLVKIASKEEALTKGLAITKITPLHLVITWEGVTGTGDNLRYQFGVKNEASTNRTRRARVPMLLTPGAKNDLFALREVQGPADSPGGLIIELGDGNERVPLAKQKPFSLVKGYAADLKNELENKPYPDRRRNDSIEFGGEKYNIVAITEKDVTVQASSTSKRTTIKR
jgi:hypothetical protein